MYRIILFIHVHITFVVQLRRPCVIKFRADCVLFKTQFDATRRGRVNTVSTRAQLRAGKPIDRIGDRSSKYRIEIYASTPEK